jgi:hypothetical protein
MYLLYVSTKRLSSQENVPLLGIFATLRLRAVVLFSHQCLPPSSFVFVGGGATSFVGIKEQRILELLLSDISHRIR